MAVHHPIQGSTRFSQSALTVGGDAVAGGLTGYLTGLPDRGLYRARRVPHAEQARDHLGITKINDESVGI